MPKSTTDKARGGCDGACDGKDQGAPHGGRKAVGVDADAKAANLKRLRRVEGQVARVLLLVAQITLMVQALIGIKLLDQGLGQLQLYIHYVGGLAPLLFLVLTYWFPATDPHRQTRYRAVAASMAFVFAFMAFTIGEAYVYRPPA